ncbi:MAG: S41 family peptidase [Bacteroidia bacterium]|nr:S41 family peptidase [Bacteroidia bacterium]MBP9923856.1 S41 family peptidase [Bacteroidia bacterium]
MKKFIKTQKLKIVIALTALVSITSYSFVDNYFEVSKNLDIFSSLYREVNMYYVDSVDPGKLMKKGIDEMLSTLDPYTNYIPESNIEDYRFMTTGQYGGIGAVIRAKGDFVIVSEPYEGFPADKSGLRAGDIILEIDGKSTKNKKTDEISRALKGSPKTEVKLLIQREGIAKPFEKILVREEIKVKPVPYFGMINNNIGYIKLNSFTENSGREVADALKELKSKNTLSGLVLDLRGNPGGLLNEAVNISNIFIPRGQEIVSTKGRYKDADRAYKAINEAVDTELPLAVMVNSGSASASEIVSGSLQDLDRAVIIGQRTFGKGLVQTTRPLSYNSQIKITTSKYYIPSGRCIQALDYTHRNEDGSVGKIPDSLVSEFKTSAGRKVYDGGGINPDYSTPIKKLNPICNSLVNKSIIFDFASRYRTLHDSIPKGDFVLTDADWIEFLKYIADKEYDYITKSEKSLEEFKKNSEDELYYETLKSDIETLQSKLNHNKQEDIDKNKTDIVALLEDEIASRYGYQQGRIRESLTHDKEIMKAIDILNDKATYTGILSGAINASAGEKNEGAKIKN